MIRLTGAILLVACCSLVGLAASRKLYRRAEQLEAAIGLTGLLASDLRYTMAPLESVLARIAQLEDALPFVAACAGACRAGQPFPQAWKRALKEWQTELLREDLQVLYHLGDVLGAVDLDGALRELDYAQFILKQRYEDARGRHKQLGGLYKTLGVLAGAGLAIVLL